MMSGNEERFQQAMNQGHSAAWDQMWDHAADNYRQALAELPDNPKALTSLGLALYELQNFKEALGFYQKATLVTPNDPVPFEKVAELHERLGNIQPATDALLKAAELYARTGDMNKAIENWSHVIRLNAENLLAHSRLAVVYERMGRKQQSVMEYLAVAALFQAAGDLSKAVQTAVHAAQVLPESAEAGQALVMLKKGQQLPKPTRPRGGTGPLLMAQVRQLDTQKDLNEEKPELDPVTIARQNALTDLAGLLFEQNEDETAQAARKGVQALVKGVTGMLPRMVDQAKVLVHLSQLVDLQAHGDNAQALAELEKAMEAGLDSSAAYFDMGMLLIEAGRLEEAVRDLQLAVKNVRYALGARLLLGQTLVKLGRFKEAVVEYLEAMKIADSQMVPEEQAEEISQLYEPIIETQAQGTPESQERLCTNISDLLARKDWYSRLSKARQQLPASAPGSPMMPIAEMLTETRGSQVVESMSKVHQLARNGNFMAAMEEAYYALQFAPTYLPLHTFMGELLLQQNHTQPAVEKFFAVATSYSVRGETRRAVEMLRKIIELSPMDMKARGRLIDQLVFMGKKDEAILEYLNLAEAYYNLADLVTARKTLTVALRFAQQMNADRSWKVKTLHRMADIDLQSLDWRQALRVYEQVRVMQPDDQHARTSLIQLNLRLGQVSQALSELDNYLSYLLTRGQREQGISFLESMVEENPKQAAIRRRLAELLRQAGRSQDAIAQLDTAGDLLVDSGDMPGAMEMVKMIITMNPPNIEDYKTVLAEMVKAAAR